MIYLNAGGGKSIKEKNIIGIFDMDTSTVSPITRRFLSEAEKAKKTESPSFEIPKSFILYISDGDGTSESGGLDESSETRICFSQLSSASLAGRIGRYREK
ncbi:MAG: hypothetical protein ACI3XL_03710 [Eubacteriales bacterium]